MALCSDLLGLVKKHYHPLLMHWKTNFLLSCSEVVKKLINGPKQKKMN